MAPLIAFEGIDGAGKTTQALFLQNRLSQEGVSPVILLREPGGTDLGEEIRQLLNKAGSLDGLLHIYPRTELFLFAAARAQLVEEVIKPSLAEGATVICDRFSASTIAYQGYGRGLEIGLAEKVVALATEELRPDLTLLLDLAPHLALLRKTGPQFPELDRFEREALAFFEKVREGYLEMAHREPETWAIIDASQSMEAIAQEVWVAAKPILGV